MDNPKYEMSLVSHKKNSSWAIVHFHDGYELYYSIKGSVKYFIGDRIYHIMPGAFVFVPKGVSHKTDSDSSTHSERILLCFNDDIVGEDLEYIIEDFSNVKVFCIQQDKQSEIQQLFNKLEAEVWGNTLDVKEKNYMLRLYIQELLILLHRYMTPYYTTLSYSEQIILNITNYIRDNFDKQISLKTISEKFNINESHLARKFKSVTTMCVSEYITQVRMSKAKTLLLETNNPISKIAELTGFNDSNYFSTVFKCKNGVSPTKFKKQRGH